MNIFLRKIDMRSRQAMFEFLIGHFRYFTMNPWNQSTSYAHNMKLHHLGLESGIASKLFDLIQTDEFYESINDLIREFGEAHNYEWQAGFNGRSGGYLVLYRGEWSPSGFKSYCKSCGQQNYKSVTENGSVCGRCHKSHRVNYPRTHMAINTFPGRSIDQDTNFENWDIASLQSRVELVCEFDSLADAIVAEAIYIAENFNVMDETHFIPETRKVLVSN